MIEMIRRRVISGFRKPGRRQLLLCALFRHRFVWTRHDHPGEDAMHWYCRCGRCGFVFGSVYFAHTASRVLSSTQVRAEVDSMMRKQDAENNAW